MKDNKLIAEFMEVPQGKHTHFMVEPFALESYADDDDLKYDISWDWLMPVVDKIESIQGVFRRGGMTNGGQQHNATETKYAMEYGMHDKVIAHAYANSRIDAEYQAVVEFIKEYN